MPHIIVEHSAKISNKINLFKLNQKLHTKLSDQETVALESIKTRSIKVDHIIIGSGQENDFIHISVLLLAGRTDELKRKMASALYDVAKNMINLEDCRLSVDISDLGVYKK